MGTTLQARFEKLLASMRDEVNAPVAHGIVERLVSVRELRVGGEILCDLLCEDGVVLPTSVYRDLMAIIDDLGLDARYKACVPVPTRRD